MPLTLCGISWCLSLVLHNMARPSSPAPALHEDSHRVENYSCMCYLCRLVIPWLVCIVKQLVSALISAACLRRDTPVYACSARSIFTSKGLEKAYFPGSRLTQPLVMQKQTFTQT